MPGVAWLSYSLVVLFLLALLEAILLSWQHTPVWGKIPGPEAQVLQQVEALACPAAGARPGPRAHSEAAPGEAGPEAAGRELSLVLKVHQLVNHLTDFLGACEEQLQALKKLKKSEKGLLLRVPISLKDSNDCVQQAQLWTDSEPLELGFLLGAGALQAEGVPSQAWMLTQLVAATYQPAFVVSVDCGLQDSASALLNEDMNQLDPPVPPKPFNEEPKMQ
ncbi:uncharacterized protein LOC130683213 [Manis pentadactyla]|uniref:uncharacterized protein LOC130683213 n=1 Tax=Manis pentadactyla TaxID=143292 RepID=UPI00255C4BBA|nr:uncharacterized protein LOC130683213 [Manis pentadactyla]